MTKLEIAKALIEEKSVDGVCTLSKKKLGEVLNKRYPDLFHSPENARSVVRVLTNAYGESKRNLKKSVRMAWNGFKLPEQEKNDYSKVILNEKRIGILSDIHFPYADMTALNAAVNYLIDFQPDCIILNGDIIDCYHLSTFDKDPRNRSFKYELDMLKEFFLQLRQLFPTQRIVYKIANHEERYEKKILQRVPEFVDIEMFNFATVIKAREYNIEVVGNKRVIRAGKLNILHAHELPKGMAGPVNPARGFFMKTKASTIGGHHHQSSEHVENNLNGDIIGCWSTGCLCELYPHYMPINKWNHGFAVVEVINDEGDFRVKNLKIIKGEVL
jgi:hypothetical protein